jgi:hypothetical protein
MRLPTQSSMVSAETVQSKLPISFATKYRKIILRIGDDTLLMWIWDAILTVSCAGLYPLVSCIMNFSTVALDLYQTVDGVNTNLVSPSNFCLSFAILIVFPLAAIRTKHSRYVLLSL